jgi:DNA-binding NarL/FixJ family response regulator
MSDIRLIICDDHTLFRHGLISLLKDQPGIFVIGEAVDGNDLIKKYDNLKPDVIITDISMPGLSGTDAVKELKLKYPDIKVLFLTMLTGEQHIYFTLKVGGLGLVNKSIERGELVYAINEVYHGRKYFGSQYDENTIEAILNKYEHKPIDMEFTEAGDVTAIEDKILIYISDGLTSAEIANEMSLSKKTIDSHRIKIMKKFELSTSSSLIRFAMKYAESKNNKV